MFKFFKKYCTNILLITIFIMGLSIFLYPYVSDFINQKVQRKEIDKYKGKVRKISYDKYDSMINDAQKYNEQLLYKTIEENLGEQKVKIFTYPYGLYSEEQLEPLKEAGYIINLTDNKINKSKNLNLYGLHRCYPLSDSTFKMELKIIYRSIRY